jgi:hypothetical protein
LVSSGQPADISFKFRAITLDCEERICFAISLPLPPFYGARSLAQKLEKSALMTQANQAIEWLSPDVANLVD